MSVFACYVGSKLQRHRCPTFGALRLRTKRVQTGRYIFIYIDKTCSTWIARDRIYFPHWPSFRIIQRRKKKIKCIKIILHGTYLFMSENRRRWLL
jgi:hypothetical protein